MYIGNFAAAQTIRKAFNTEDGAGNAVTLLGSPTVAVYKDGNLTQVTTGTTLTVDYDSVTGLNMLIIDTSADGTFYAAGSDYKVVLSAGTVAGVSVVGKVLVEFAISNRTPNLATIADAVWDELLTSGHEIDNSAADILRTTETAIQAIKTDTDAYLDAAVSDAVAAAEGIEATFDDSAAIQIAAKVVAARGDYYPLRSLVWVLQRSTDGIVVKDGYVQTKGASEIAVRSIDFAGLLGRNEAVEEINSVSISGGTFELVDESTTMIGNIMQLTITDGDNSELGTVSFDVSTTAGQRLQGEVQISVPE